MSAHDTTQDGERAAGKLQIDGLKMRDERGRDLAFATAEAADRRATGSRQRDALRPAMPRIFKEFQQARVAQRVHQRLNVLARHAPASRDFGNCRRRAIRQIENQAPLSPCQLVRLVQRLGGVLQQVSEAPCLVDYAPESQGRAERLGTNRATAGTGDSH